MFAKKSHSWFWYAFWSLVAAALIYLIARFFASTTESYHDKKAAKNPANDKELFI